MKRFTDKWVLNLKPKPAKQEYNNGDGFILRVAVSGNKTFYFRYTIEGKKKLYKIGVYPSCSLADARKIHLDLWTKFKNGIDVQETKEVETIEDLALYWLEMYVAVNRKSTNEVKRIIKHDIIPSLGKVKLKNVTTLKLTSALDKIVKRGSKVQANRVFSAIKQMFNFGISKGHYEGYNPLHATKQIDIGGDEPPRDRNLSMKELCKVWLYFDSTNHHLPQSTVLAFKLLILTGCRLSEVRAASWSEFDFDNSLWTIPKERYKTKIEHKIYLTPVMIDLLSQLKSLSNKSLFILPSKTDSNKPLGDKALSRAMARQQGEIDIEQFTIHDLRRTMASRMNDYLDIDPVVIEKVLGHKLPKIFETYQKSEMLDKRQDALIKWSDAIITLTSNTNVLPFQKAG